MSLRTLAHVNVIMGSAWTLGAIYDDSVIGVVCGVALYLCAVVAAMLDDE